MAKKNHNRSRPKSKGLSRRERQAQNLLSAKLNPQSAAGKNARRREIAQKNRKLSEQKILDVLGRLATKLDDMLALFVKQDNRQKKEDQEKEHRSLSRKMWDAMAPKGMRRHVAAFGLGGMAAAGLVSLMDNSFKQAEPTEGIDEAPQPLPEGVQVINGAKLYMAPGVNLDGMNQDFLKRFTDAVREYQEVYKGGVVRINSGYRSLAQQKEIYEKDKAEHGGTATKSAAPGRSMHEYGFALDTNTTEANAMEALGLFAKHGLVRSEKKISKKTGKLIETWHVEDAKMQGLKKKLRDVGADSVFAIRMRKGLDPETGLPDEESIALANQAANILRQAEMIEVANQLATLQESMTGNAGEVEIPTVKAAQGAMVNVVAGEAGPELILPLNQRGGEILANSISDAFKEMAASRSRMSSVEKFKTFFEGRFLPELRRQLGKN